MNIKYSITVILSCLLSGACNEDSSVRFINGDGPEYSENTGEETPSVGLPISPILVGTNAWYTDPSQQVWDLTENCGVTSIRIGGNAFNNNMPTNSSLLEWVNKIQGMGAEPILQVSQVDSPEAAAALVQYFNIDLASGQKIKYWNIGNEPYLFYNNPGESNIGAMVESYFKERAAAMKAVDPTIKIYGPDFAWYIEQGIDDLFGGANNIAGKVPGQEYYYCDGISWHRYPQDASIDLAYEGLDDFKQAIIKCKEKVDQVNSQLNRTGEEALGWGIGEYNAKGGPQVHTWKNGQMFGGILGLCMEYGATYATSWSMFEHGGDRQGTDFSFIDGANMIPRPTYRHMQMIAQNFSGNYVDGKSSNSNVVVFGAIDGGKISVMVMNRSNSEISFNLNLNYTDVEFDATTIAINIDAGSELSYVGNIEALATHTYVFENNELVRTAYVNSNFINEEPPTVTNL